MLVISCNSKKDEKEITNKPKASSLNFDKILLINEYINNNSDSGSFFTTSYDYGITYDPKRGNDLGNLVTFLIPKDFLFFQKHSKYSENDEGDALKGYVNKLSIEELKKIFDIYVFLIDKKYLVPTPGYDSPYNIRKGIKPMHINIEITNGKKLNLLLLIRKQRILKKQNGGITLLKKKLKKIKQPSLILFLN